MAEHKAHLIRNTSLDSYINILKKMGERQQQVFACLFKLCKEQEDATDFEITKALNKEDPNYVRPRRYELLNKLKVIESSRRRICKVTGRNAIAWKVK